MYAGMQLNFRFTGLTPCTYAGTTASSASIELVVVGQLCPSLSGRLPAAVCVSIVWRCACYWWAYVLSFPRPAGFFCLHVHTACV